MVSRIKYNKEDSGKRIGRGGPRDVQMRQRLMHEERIRREITNDNDALVPHIEGATKKSEKQVDLSGYLPLEEVRKKIEEAVSHTKQAEKDRYNSGLRNLNDQLKATRKKYAGVEETLINKNAEIKRLTNQISKTPTISKEALDKINKKDLQISKKESELETKKELYNRSENEIKRIREQLKELSRVNSELSKSIASKDVALAEAKAFITSKEEYYDQTNSSFKDLQNKMDELYNKIADGSIQPLVGSKMERPELETKIFIDPIEVDNKKELDSHIKIEEEEQPTDVPEKDITSDLAKLRNLLKLK